MSHKYNDVVLFVRGKDTVPALVVQSNPQPDGEHLTVVFLDPAAESNSMSGMAVDKAIQRAFVSPLADGRTYGWKDLPAPAPAQPSAADLDAHAAEQKVKEATDTEDAKAFELAAAINKGLGKS